MACNPEQQTIDRFLNETEEEWRESVAKKLANVDVLRLAGLVESYLS